MATNTLKSPKYVDGLLVYIQKNDIKNAEGILNQYPDISNEKCLDGLEPIFFCIRNHCNKVFGLLLKKMDINEDLFKNIYLSIQKEGTPKMLKMFLEHFKISQDDPCLSAKDKEMLLEYEKAKKEKENL